MVFISGVCSVHARIPISRFCKASLTAFDTPLDSFDALKEHLTLFFGVSGSVFSGSGSFFPCSGSFVGDFSGVFSGSVFFGVLVFSGLVFSGELFDFPPLGAVLEFSAGGVSVLGSVPMAGSGGGVVVVAAGVVDCAALPS